MEQLIIATVIAVWLPICMVFVTKLMWNLLYLQSQDYRLPNLRLNLRWDSELLYEPVWMIVVKVALFCLIATGLIFPGAAVVILAMVLTYALWIHQSIEIVQRVYTKKLPKLELNLLNILNLAIQAIVVMASILILTIPLFTNTFPESNFTGYYLSYLLPQSVNGLTLIPDFYLFLIFSFLLGIALELGSPVLTLISTILARPVQIIHDEWQLWDAHKLLSDRPQLIKILITGTLGKTTVKQYLSRIIGSEFRLIAPQAGENYPASLAQFINRNLQPDTEILIVDVNASTGNDISRIAKLLRPQIVVFTGIDEHSTTSGYNSTDLFFQHEEMFKDLPQDTKLFINLDDEGALELARKHNRLETFYGFNQSNIPDIKYNQMTLTTYLADEPKHNPNTEAWNLTVDWGAHKVNLELPKTLRHSKHSLVASIAVALELGITLEKIEQRLSETENILYQSQIYTGDNDSTLLYTGNKSSANTILHDIALAKEMIQPQRLVLVVGGNQRITSTLLDGIRQQVDTIISHNSKLIQQLKHENTNINIIRVRSRTELIYQARQYMNPQTCLVISGIKDPLILKELSKNIS